MLYIFSSNMRELVKNSEVKKADEEAEEIDAEAEVEAETAKV